MINLQDSSGLPLLFNTSENSLQPAGDLHIGNIEKIKLDMVRPILLNKTLKYPFLVYTEYSDIMLTQHKEIFEKHDLHYSTIVLPPGLLGIEYNKTHIFAPDNDKNDITAIVDVIHGRGIVLTQKVKEKSPYEFETEVDFANMFSVRKGDRIPIEQKNMYTFVNSSSSAFIIGRLFEDDGKIDYRTIRREQGMSYYFIRKNARREIVKNPRYKDLPRLKRVKADTYAKKHRLTSQKPIYTQFIRDPKRFEDMLV